MPARALDMSIVSLREPLAAEPEQGRSRRLLAAILSGYAGVVRRASFWNCAGTHHFRK
jgi:hypothetical protein